MFWRSYDGLIVTGRCVVKSYCPKCPYFWGDFLVEGVKGSICVFDLDLGPKMTSTIWCCTIMITWYDDTLLCLSMWKWTSASTSTSLRCPRLWGSWWTAVVGVDADVDIKVDVDVDVVFEGRGGLPWVDIWLIIWITLAARVIMNSTSRNHSKHLTVC